MKSLEYLVVAGWLGLDRHECTVQWVEHEVATNPAIEPELFEVLEGDSELARAALEHVAGLRYADFSIQSEDGQRAAKLLVIEQLEAVLAEQITPLLFCDFIQRFETFFMDATPKGSLVVEYPDFVGRLWHACDWCDEAWRLDVQVGLREEAERTLLELRGQTG